MVLAGVSLKRWPVTSSFVPSLRDSIIVNTVVCEQVEIRNERIFVGEVFFKSVITVLISKLHLFDARKLPHITSDGQEHRYVIMSSMFRCAHRITVLQV